MTAGRSQAQPTTDAPIALITGGTGALGSVLLREFRHAGYRLAVPVRSTSKLPQIPDDGAFSSVADLSKEDDVTGFVGDVLSRFGRVDVLLHAAGGFSGGEPLESTSVADWNRMLQINLQTAFLTIRAVLPAMRAQARGRIICLASQTGMVPAPQFAAYGVSKRALIALVEATAEELRGSGVTCNALAPGTILTQANREAMPGADIRTWVRPEDIAALCLFLASNAGTAVNGSILRLPGGA